MEPFALILAAMLAQTEAAAPPPPPPPAAEMTREQWVAEFDRLDTNRDGRLTREERRAGGPGGMRRGPGPRRGMGPRPGGPDAMPIEGTRDAWLARAAERFDRIDTNRDGRIDAAEAQAARPRR